MMKKRFFVLFALCSLQALAVHPTNGPLQNDPALCAYGYNPRCYPQYQAPLPPPPPPRTTYYAPYVALAYGKDSTPLFYRDTYYSDYEGFYDIDWQTMKNFALNSCNDNSKYAPCKSGNLAVIWSACIAVVETEHKFYADGGNSCAEAKKIAMGRCHKENPKSKKNCKVHALEQPHQRCKLCSGISPRKAIP